MEFNVNNNESKSIYVDKDNLHIATENSLIRINVNNVDSNLDIYVNLLAGFLNLNNNQKAIINVLLNEKANVLNSELVKKVAKIINKTNCTVRRELEDLHKKRIVNFMLNGNVKIAESYNVNVDNLNTASVIALIVNNGR